MRAPLETEAPSFYRSQMGRRIRSERTPLEQRPEGQLKGSRRQRIAQLLSSVEKRLDLTNSKVTLADFIRLTQLERELEEDEQPREIIVTWKDPAEKR